MKTDFKKTIKSYKAKKGKFEIIEIPKMQYLMIDGHGDPNTSKEFKDALETLYPVAYKLKFMSKLNLEKDYVVSPLEGLWWSKDMSTFTTNRDKSHWDWTAMLMVPDWITQDMFETAKLKAREKSNKNFDKLRFESYEERLVVQILHVGSYDNEANVLEEMHNKFIPENKFKMIKKHHEIYLSDFRKVAPEKLRTILRQPVEKV